jgi:hypothetical protein
MKGRKLADKQQNWTLQRPSQEKFLSYILFRNSYLRTWKWTGSDLDTSGEAFDTGMEPATFKLG